MKETEKYGTSINGIEWEVDVARGNAKEFYVNKNN